MLPGLNGKFKRSITRFSFESIKIGKKRQTFNFLAEGGDSSGGNTSRGDSGMECIDIGKKCNILQKYKLCSKYHAYSLAYCAKSCNKCDELKKCQDLSPRCKKVLAKIKKGGRCSRKTNLYCRKSCGVCA